jgi:hypothetical protein
MTNTATETESTITISEVGDLYLQYRGQHGAQPVYVQLDCEAETLSAEVDGSIGPGTPARVWHGRAIRWSIPALTESAAEGLLLDLIPLAQRVVDGYECRWDGSNHVGRLTEDAREAAEAIRDLCDRDWEGQTIEAWDAYEWFGPVGNGDCQRKAIGITAETTDEELAAIVTREENEAHPRILNGAAEYLRNLRDGAREAEEETEED